MANKGLRFCLAPAVLLLLLATCSAPFGALDNPYDPKSVGYVAVTAVTLDRATMSLAVVGGIKGSLKATLAPANATGTDVAWSSSDASVATAAKGVVTPLSAGSATITATTVDGGKTATCTVSVTAIPISVTGVSLSPTTLSLKVGGETGTLVTTITPGNASNSNVAWISSNTSVATVSGLGIVTPVSAGTSTVTVTTADGSFTATCAVTVTVPVALAPIWKVSGKRLYVSNTPCIMTMSPIPYGTSYSFQPLGVDIPSATVITVSFTGTPDVAFPNGLSIALGNGTPTSTAQILRITLAGAGSAITSGSSFTCSASEATTGNSTVNGTLGLMDNGFAGQTAQHWTVTQFEVSW
ncbi:MAG: Ig-like domain-containing protein [Spirochaetota bacterium]